MTQEEIPDEKSRVDILIEEYQHNFFKSQDLRAAAAIGLYYRITSFQQVKILGTRTLIKDTRVWFKEFNKQNLLQIFAECNRLQFSIADKERNPFLYLNDLRKLIESELKVDNWISSPEEVSLAFMIGYDSFISRSQKESN